ncbi:MAG: adenylate/guanylate cyclase domain-containing protein, partial [Bacteroidota bacterium]
VFTGQSQESKADSLLRLSAAATTDTAKVRLMIKAAQTSRRSDPKKSISIGSDALELAKKSDFGWGVAMGHRVQGNAYYDLSDYPNAMANFEKALEVFGKIGDQAGEAAMLNGMGAIFYDRGDDTKAISHYLRSMKIAESLGDMNRVHTIQLNLGAIYERKEKTRDQALEYNLLALEGFKALGKTEEYSLASANTGEIYLKKGDLKQAEKYFLMSVEALPGDNSTVCFALTKLGEVYAQEGQLAKSKEFHERSVKIATAQDANRELTEALIGLAKTLVLEKDYRSAVSTYEQAIRISTTIDLPYRRRDAYQELARLHSILGNYQQAFDYQIKLDALKDTLFNTDEQNKIQQMQFTFDLDQKQNQLDLKDLRLRQQEYIGYGVAIFLVLVVIISIVIYQRYAFARKTNAIIQAERDKSKELLLNILPEETAHELEVNGFATTRHHDEVSVLFTDFKGFSTIAGKLTPQELVNELNKYFVAFDDITDRHHLEKIKTIGDAYMCAAGIPTDDPEHALHAVQAALEMQQFMASQIEQRKSQGLEPWELRVGVHSGPVVAGVVGKRKYAYDIWGDAVNIASRMESTGQPGKVNISAATYERIKQHFIFEYRGKLAAKNVGEIDMYFVQPGEPGN